VKTFTPVLVMGRNRIVVRSRCIKCVRRRKEVESGDFMGVGFTTLKLVFFVGLYGMNDCDC